MKNKIFELLGRTESYFVYFLEKLSFLFFLTLSIILILTLFILLNIYDIDVILEGLSLVPTLVYIFLVK